MPRDDRELRYLLRTRNVVSTPFQSLIARVRGAQYAARHVVHPL